MTDHLHPEDRRWLRAHGWTPPPPDPQWDEQAEELVVICPECTARLVLEHVDLLIYASSEPIGRSATNFAEVLAHHRREYEQQE